MTLHSRALTMSALILNVLACVPQTDSAAPERAVSSAAIASARSLLQSALGSVDSVILVRSLVGFDDYKPVVTDRASPKVPLDSALVRNAIELRHVDGSCVTPADCGASASTGLVVLSAVQMKSATAGTIRLLLWARQSHVVFELEFERVGENWMESRREQILIS